MLIYNQNYFKVQLSSLSLRAAAHHVHNLFSEEAPLILHILLSLFILRLEVGHLPPLDIFKGIIKQVRLIFIAYHGLGALGICIVVVFPLLKELEVHFMGNPKNLLVGSW